MVEIVFEFGCKDTEKVSILSGKWRNISDSAEYKRIFFKVSLRKTTCKKGKTTTHVRFTPRKYVLYYKRLLLEQQKVPFF